jgi:hypothetical protein
MDKDFKIEIESPNYLFKANQINTDNDINNYLSTNNTETNPKSNLGRTKTTKALSRKKTLQKKKSPRKKKKISNGSDKKVKFKDKIDIVKVECWKKYNLEQTADEKEYLEEDLEDFIGGTNGNDNKSTTNVNSTNEKSNNSNKNETNKNENNKGANKRNINQKKGNYTCICNIL